MTTFANKDHFPSATGNEFVHNLLWQQDTCIPEDTLKQLKAKANKVTSKFSNKV